MSNKNDGKAAGVPTRPASDTPARPAAEPTWDEIFEARMSRVRPGRVLENIADDIQSLLVNVNIESDVGAIDQIVQMLDWTKYQGFNAMQMRADAARIAASQDAAHPMRALLVLMSLYCNRGPNIDKILREIDPQGRSALQQLVVAFNLKKKPEMGATRRNTMTLPRLAICFCEMTCRMAMKVKPANQVMPGNEEVRWCIRLPCFAALIPQSERNPQEDTLLKCHIIFMTKQGLIWKAKSPSDIKLETVTDQIKWVRLNSDNGYHTNAQRRNILNSILGQNWSLNVTERALAAEFDSLGAHF